MSADSKPNVVRIVSNDGTSVCAVSMNATYCTCCAWVSAAVKLKTITNAKLSQSCGDCSRI